MGRVAITILATLLSCACTSSMEVKDSDVQATVATVAEEGCDQPSVRIDSITSSESGASILLKDRYGSVFLAPGRYAISVACQNPLNESRNKCEFWGHPNEYPTYKMPLSAGVKYTFRCSVERQDISYRISEEVL